MKKIFILLLSFLITFFPFTHNVSCNLTHVIANLEYHNGYKEISWQSSLQDHKTRIFNLNPTLYINYNEADFTHSSDEESQKKFASLFSSQFSFCQTYNTRKILIKILDPSKYTFFNPQNFDKNKDNNFLYWVKRFRSIGTVEVVFDSGPFSLNSQAFKDAAFQYGSMFLQVQPALEGFKHLETQLLWLSTVNDFEEKSSSCPLVQGIVIDGEHVHEELFQLILNAVDQYRSNASPYLPKNSHHQLKVGAFFTPDQKDMLFANIARFPLMTDLKSDHRGELGIELLKHFPSAGPTYLPPQWRQKKYHAILDYAYVNLSKDFLNAVDASIQNPVEKVVEKLTKVSDKQGNKKYCWLFPKVSRHLISKVYFMLPTTYSFQENDCISYNYQLGEVLNFFYNPNKKSGLLNQKLFRSFDGTYLNPENNFVFCETNFSNNEENHSFLHGLPTLRID